MDKTYITLAFRNILRRKLRSFLTVLGIFIGVAAVVALISLSKGMQDTITEEFVSLGSDKIIIQAAGSSFGPPGTGVTIPLSVKEKDLIGNVRGVDISLGRLIRSAKITFKDETKFLFTASVSENKDEKEILVEANGYELSSGRWFDEGSKEVVISYDFAKEVFKKKVDLRDKILIESTEFKVVGILEPSGQPQQDNIVLLSESEMRDVLGIDTDYDVIIAKVESEENINRVASDISKILRRYRDVDEGKENFSLSTPEKVLATLISVLVVIQGVLVGIASIALAVSSIGIMNTMYTSVVERTKEIGVLRSIGAQRQVIRKLFILESGLLGFAGGVLGVIFGLILGKVLELVLQNIYDIQIIRASFSPSILLTLIIASTIIGAISGFFPANEASYLSPVEAMRK